MNVIDEFTEMLGEPPALSLRDRDRAKEKLMNELMTLEVAEPAHRRRPPRRPSRHRIARRVALAVVVAAAAVAVAVVGVGAPGRSPLSPPPASAAALAMRAVADTQRALPDTPPDVKGVDPGYVAAMPVLRELPLDGSPADTWAWIDAHCQAVRTSDATEQAILNGKDCGLMAVFGFLAVATPAQTATLLDALASLPTIQTVDGKCQAGGGAVLHGSSQEFRVSRNGTDTVITLTHDPSGSGQLWSSMTLWDKSVPPPCPRAMPTH